MSKICCIFKLCKLRPDITWWKKLTRQKNKQPIVRECMYAYDTGAARKAELVNLRLDATGTLLHAAQL